MTTERFKVGDAVNVKLANGYKSSGVIVRLFLNGRYGVTEMSKGKPRYFVRSQNELSPGRP